jgi:hypothetical protein
MSVSYFDQQTYKPEEAVVMLQNVTYLVSRGFLQFVKNSNGETVFKIADEERAKKYVNDIERLELSSDGKTLTRTKYSITGGAPGTYQISMSGNMPVLSATLDSDIRQIKVAMPLGNITSLSGQAKNGESAQGDYLIRDMSKYAVGGTARKQYNTSGFFDELQQYALPIALAFALPGIGAAIGSQIFAAQIAAGAMTAATASAIGTAIVSTAIQTSQGVDFETALQNATVNAVVSTQSPTIANDISKAVGSPGVADAITSAGASIVSTMAKGGSAEDALKNAGAAIVASGVSGETDRTVGAAVGGAITGGAAGAAAGAAGELGRPTGGSSTSTSTGTSAGGVDTTSDSSGVGDVVVTGQKETAINDTNIQLPDLSTNNSNVTVTATRLPTDVAATDVQVMDEIRNQNASTAVNQVTPIEITAPRDPTKITDTDIQVADTTTLPVTRTETPVEITASRIPTNIAETDIQTVTELPKVEVTTSKIPPTIADTDIQVEDTETPVDKTEEEPKKPSLYEPDLFIYSGKTPKKSTLSRSLGTDLQSSSSPSTITQGLTAARGAGEIEGEGGTNRKNVWNEESLRLKDALGL